MTQSNTPPRWRFWPNRRASDPEQLEPDTTAPVSQCLEIVCCGVFEARYDGVDMAFTRSRKARELLAFLATRPGMTASCDEAMTALWPDAEPDRARRLLINAAWRIRCALRERGMTDPSAFASALRFDHGRYTLDGSHCTCDLARYRAEQAHAEAYLRLYGNAQDDSQGFPNEAQRLVDLDRLVERPLLAGEMYSWLPALERQIRNLRLTSLRRALRLASHGSAQELALGIAERILTLDVLDEPTVSFTLRLHLARGDSASAAAIYRTFRLALARRYSSAAPTLAQPSRELQALFAQAVGEDVAAHEPSPITHPAEPPPALAQAPPL